MQLMAERGIAVEVNLTSNEFITRGRGRRPTPCSATGVPPGALHRRPGRRAQRPAQLREYAGSWPPAARPTTSWIKAPWSTTRSSGAFLDDATKDRLKTTLDERFTAFEDAMAAYAAARQASAPAAPRPSPPSTWAWARTPEAP
ncbi:MAG: hypothetical protein R3F62_05170 [Planctomycetota bacterium]